MRRSRDGPRIGFFAFALVRPSNAFPAGIMCKCAQPNGKFLLPIYPEVASDDRPLPEYPAPDNQQPTSPTGVHRPIQALAPRHPACFFLVKNKCSGFESNLLDTTPRIGLLGKMKLRKCAPIAGPPRIGFFVRVCALSRASPDPPRLSLERFRQLKSGLADFSHVW